METSNLPVAILLFAIAAYLVLPGTWRQWRWLNCLTGWLTMASIVAYAIVGGNMDHFNQWFPWILIGGIGAVLASFLPSPKARE